MSKLLIVLYSNLLTQPYFTFTSGAFKGCKLLPQGLPSAVLTLGSNFHEKFIKQKLFSNPKNHGPRSQKLSFL